MKMSTKPASRILLNAIQCRKCLAVVVSRHVHDFVWCPCHAVAVDGGTDYLKRVGELKSYTELSVEL